MFIQQYSKISFQRFLRPQDRHFLPGVFTAGGLPDEPGTKHVLVCLDHVQLLCSECCGFFFFFKCVREEKSCRLKRNQSILRKVN